MRVEDLHLAPRDLHAHPQGATGFQRAQTRIAGQGAGANQPLRQAGQDGVAILFLLDPNGCVEMEIHRQASGDLVRLIDAVGAGAAHVQFLQGDDFRVEACDHLSDSTYVQAAVEAHAAAHIVGDDPRHRGLGARPIAPAQALPACSRSSAPRMNLTEAPMETGATGSGA